MLRARLLTMMPPFEAAAAAARFCFFLFYIKRLSQLTCRQGAFS